MLISESYINTTEGYRFGDSDPYEPWTEDIGQLFKALQKEYGRCVSRVYIDVPDQPTPMPIGWVFRKRMRYEDARTNTPKDYYTREVWITLHDRAPEKSVQHFYHDLRAGTGAGTSA